MFKGNLPTWQAYSFQPTAIDAPNLQDQGTNRQSKHAGNSREFDHGIHQTEKSWMRSNDSCSSECNSMQIAKLISSKCRKYNGDDEKSCDEFVDQYLAASCDICLPPSPRQKYLYNRFHVEALRFYDANIPGRARQFSEVLQMMKEKINSASNQQKFRPELPELFYVNFLGRTGGDKRKVFKEQKNHIENTFRYAPGPGGMRLISSGSCAMHPL